jgi:MFS family permease
MPRSASKASLTVVFMTVVVDLLGFGLVLPLIPVYAKELMTDFSDAQMAWTLGLLMTCYSIMQLVFAPFWGRVSDRVGRRPILILSLAGSTFFYGLFGLATMWGSLTWMFVSRAAGGIAGATIPTAQAYIADITPMEKRTRGMALIGVAFGLGFTFGPLLGALALMGETSAGVSPWPGFTAAGFSLAALTVAVFKLSESLDPKTATPTRTHLDIKSLWEALAVPSIVALLAVLFLCNFGFANFEATLSLVLSSFLGVEKGGREILLAFAYIGVVQAVVQAFIVRRMAVYASEGTLCFVGMLLAILGYFGLALTADPQTGGALGLMVAASIVVAGLGFVYPSLQSLISRRSDPAKQGGVLGLGGSLNSLARITGIIVAMRVHTFRGPTAPFWAATGLMLLALFLIAIAVRSGEDWSPEGVGAVEEQNVSAG